MRVTCGLNIPAEAGWSLTAPKAPPTLMMGTGIASRWQYAGAVAYSCRWSNFGVCRMTDVSAEIRDFWDADAATYDHSAGHAAHTRAEQAAWIGELRRLLPAPPARVLDLGAGTGFLSLPLAALGHDVTALDVAPAMLARLTAKAAQRGLPITAMLGDAAQPPDGPFDVIIERHVVWTLTDPSAALRAWRAAAPQGRLVLLESMWGGAADPAEAALARARKGLRALRRTPPDHHGEYSDQMRQALPLAGGTTPERLLEMVDASGWGPAALHRLRDVEWAMELAVPLPERLLGVTPRFAVLAGP